MGYKRGRYVPSINNSKNLEKYYNSVIFEDLELPDERDIPLHTCNPKTATVKDTFLNTQLEYEGYGKYNRVFNVRLVEENIESKIIKDERTE